MAKKKKKTKLGDLVERFTKPIAKAIDKVAGTDLENCEGCKKRKEYLNNLTSKEDINTLSEEDTELLTDYFGGRWRTLDSKLQRRLHGVIERGLGIRINNTTSCVPCWNANEEFLLDVAEKNGIEHGKIRKQPSRR